MNLDKAFFLLFASVGAVAAFAPAGPAARSVASRAPAAAFLPKVRVAISLSSEVEEAAEAPVEAEEASEEAAAAPAEPAFETSIYIGNVAFDAVESDIRAAFAEHGTVQKVQMPLNRDTVSHLR